MVPVPEMAAVALGLPNGVVSPVHRLFQATDCPSLLSLASPSIPRKYSELVTVCGPPAAPWVTVTVG